MKYEEARKQADHTMVQLGPYCYRIEIIGSIRCKEPEVNKIEMALILKPYVLIPEPYNIGLFVSGVESVVNQRTWRKVKGELPCDHMQRILPEGIKLDLFFAEHDNQGNIFAIRTGSADFSHKRLASEWVSHGYKSEVGYLYKDGERIAIREEEDLFKLLKIRYVEPEEREY